MRRSANAASATIVTPPFVEKPADRTPLQWVLWRTSPHDLVLAQACRHHLLPAAERAGRQVFGLRRQQPDDVATVLFSSGSTGVRRACLLSHHNLLSNVEGVRNPCGSPHRQDHGRAAVLPRLRPHRLPVGCAAVGHRRRLSRQPARREDHRQAGGRACATVLMSTADLLPELPADLRAPRSLATIRHTLVGAERFPASLARRLPRGIASPCSKAMAARRWGRSSPSTLSTSTHGAHQNRPATSPAPSAIPYRRGRQRSSMSRAAKCCRPTARACCW